MAELGFNRLSFGVQSFSEPALRWMGRMHGADGARRAVALAREIAARPNLRFAGLQAYHGAAQHQRSVADRRQALQQLARRK